MKKYSPENPDRWQRVQVAFGLIAIGWKQGYVIHILPREKMFVTNYWPFDEPMSENTKLSEWTQDEPEQ
jgi:hypothetical protein